MGSVDLSLPNELDLLQAAGRVALAHGQLELMLRMTIKSLAGLTIQEVLHATRKSKNWDLRNEIVAHFNSKTKNPALRLKLKAILGKCEHLSEERNRLLHNAWAIAEDGSVVMKGSNHVWGPAPTPHDLNVLAEELNAQVSILNRERLDGFIRDVLEDPH